MRRTEIGDSADILEMAEHDLELDGWSRPWNARPNAGRLAGSIPPSHLWASEDGGLDQVGCIYTAQGFEFDYVGVIFGPDLVYRPREGWIGRANAHLLREPDRPDGAGRAPGPRPGRGGSGRALWGRGVHR